MVNITESASSLLKSKWFWYGVAAVVVIFIIWKYKARINQFFSRDNGDYSLGIGDTPNYVADNATKEAKKNEIIALALRVYTSINDAGFDRIPAFKEVLKLNDSELKFLAREYKKISPDESLYEAIDDEWLFLDNEDDEILARLSKLNEL